MKTRSFILIFSFFIFHFSSSQTIPEKFPVIPEPVSVKADKDFFLFSGSSYFGDKDHKCKNEIEIFYTELAAIGYTKMNVPSSQKNPEKAPVFLDVDTSGIRIKGSYELRITPKQISIKGDKEGVFHALQTLIQLFPPGPSAPVKIPCVEIKDYPRFNWRGMHLDVCRHFFSKEEVKKYIDYLALYKFNVFHWHLTEDQGWRIEIKKYPKLTQVGSIRKETIIGKQNDTAKYDGKPYGGFYTQEDVKEIVAYAQARFITVVPEIEMPGHSLAALAAYPFLSCTGKTVETGTRWGVYEDVYCPGKDSTFDFLEDVLNEVCDLFPGKYIHIGGDECMKDRWKTCVNCQKRIKTEKLKDENELQSYFIRRIEKYLNSKGRQIIGWDEILEGGLAPNAAVMSWRGTEGGIAAAKEKHFVVMSPGQPCYFDHYQSKEKEREPLAIGGYNPVEHVYVYEPVPKELSAAQHNYILGAQGNVWTEYIPSFKQVEYMSVPRMCALSEVLWTPPEKKKLDDFVLRLKKHSLLLDKMGVNYAKHFKDIK